MRTINVQSDFGAIGDGSTEDRIKVIRAVAALQQSGGVLYFPAGTYTFTDAISFNDLPISIVGDGPGLTNLVWISSGVVPNGIRFLGKLNHQFTIRSISILARGECGTAVSCERVLKGAPGYEHFLSDFSIGGETENTGHWQLAINLISGRETQIKHFHIYGRNGQSLLMRGIQLMGSTTDLVISDGHIVDFNDGIFAGDRCEGIDINSVVFVGGRTGFSTDYSGDGHSVSNCHFNTTDFGIFAVNTNNISVHHNLFFIGKYGVRCNGAASWSFIGNKFVGVRSASGKIGIELIGQSDHCVIQGNLFNTMDTAVVLRGRAIGCVVMGNTLVECGGNGLGIVDENLVLSLICDNLWKQPGTTNIYRFPERRPDFLPNV